MVEFPSEERQLLASLEAGDRRAAELLVDRTYAQIYAALFRLTGGDRDLASDLTQETFRKAWKSLDSFDRRSRLSTWLYRISYNTFLNHIRRPARLESLEENRGAVVRDPAPGQDERMHRREVQQRLRRAIIGLPEALRFTITARFWAELPVEEIARLEDITGAAVRKRLKKAIQDLRHTLGEDAL